MLATLPYHDRLKEHFKEQKKLWDFFSGEDKRKEQVENYKLELLKNTYKFDKEKENHLYSLLEKAKEKLGLSDVQGTFYQASYTEDINANVVYHDKEAHFVFSGLLLRLLNDDELLAVIAHELAHIRFSLMHNGEFEVCERIVLAIANSSGQSDQVYYNTARLFRLHTELFCDRGALLVCGEIGPVISALVKSATGLDNIDVDSYLKQATEALEKTQDEGSKAFSHPENFIRVKAIEWWKGEADSANEKILAMLQGQQGLDQLDLFQQEELHQFTLKFLQLFLKPNWFRTGLVLSHARQFYTDFQVKDEHYLDTALLDKLSAFPESIKTYLAYILYDFVQLDPALEQVPLGWAFQFSEDLLIKEAFMLCVKKEQGLSEKRLQVQREEALQAFRNLKEGESEQIYND